MLNSAINLILIFLIIMGFVGVFLFKKYYKKNACLFLSFINSIILIYILAAKNDNFTKIAYLTIIFSLIMAVKLYAGIVMSNKLSEK
jgi:hypothetical protein